MEIFMADEVNEGNEKISDTIFRMTGSDFKLKSWMDI